MGIGIDKYVTRLKKPDGRDGPLEKSLRRKAWLSKGLPHSSPPLSGPAGQVVAVVLSCVVMRSLFSYFLVLLKLYSPYLFFFLSFRFSFSLILMAFCVTAFVYFTDPVFSKIIFILFYVYSFLILIWNILLCA